jgi:hypothetical protein
MAAGATYEPISTTTLGSAQSSVSFSSFGGYTDLILVANFATSLNLTYGTYIQINGDSGGNYSVTTIKGNGSTATSTRQSSTEGIRFMLPSSTSSSFSNMAIVNFMNYTNATTYKTILARNNNANTVTELSVGLWRNTNAITSFVYGGDGGQNFAIGSTFTLYGIAAA